MAFADEDRGDQGGCASCDVHDDAAGKVEDAHRAEEAGLAPDHMGDRHVDQQTPQAAEPHDAREGGLGKVADKGIVSRKGQAITAESPDNGNQRRYTKTMDENGQHIAAANQAGVEHGQTRDHHKEY